MSRPIHQGPRSRPRPPLRAALLAAGIAAAAGALAVLVASAGAAPGGDVIGAKRAQIRQLEGEVQSIDAQAGAAADAHAEAVRRADELRARIVETRQGLAQARRDRAIALDRLSRRIVGLYTQGDPSLVEIVLASGDLTAVTETQDALEAVGRQDAAMVDRIHETKIRLTRLTAALESDRAEADAAVTESAARMGRLRSLIASRRSVLDRARGSLNQLVARRAAQAADARAAAAEAAAERALLRRAAPSAPPVASPSAPAASAPVAPAATPSVSTGPAPSGDVMAALQRIAQCESGGNPQAVSPSGQYRGKYQFDMGTWQSLGGTGDPAAAPEAEQDRIAAILYNRSGPAPWPVCGYR